MRVLSLLVFFRVVSADYFQDAYRAVKGAVGFASAFDKIVKSCRKNTEEDPLVEKQFTCPKARKELDGQFSKMKSDLNDSFKVLTCAAKNMKTEGCVENGVYADDTFNLSIGHYVTSLKISGDSTAVPVYMYAGENEAKKYRIFVFHGTQDKPELQRRLTDAIYSVLTQGGWSPTSQYGAGAGANTFSNKLSGCRDDREKLMQVEARDCAKLYKAIGEHALSRRSDARRCERHKAFKCASKVFDDTHCRLPFGDDDADTAFIRPKDVLLFADSAGLEWSVKKLLGLSRTHVKAVAEHVGVFLADGTLTLLEYGVEEHATPIILYKLAKETKN